MSLYKRLDRLLDRAFEADPGSLWFGAGVVAIGLTGLVVLSILIRPLIE